MAITKKIVVDEQEVEFRASAAIPRLYRIKFHRDIYRDLAKLENEMKDETPDASGIDVESLEVFENIAYIMARHADPTIPDSVDEWLEQFNTFSIYQVFPAITELWGLNTAQDVQAKKNNLGLSEK